MRSTGQGYRLRSDLPAFPGDRFAGLLRPRADVPNGAAATVLNDYWWGTGTVTPLSPIQIPICWLSQPVKLRLEQPINAATVSVPGGPTGRYRDDASIAVTRARFPFTATLTTNTPSDATNLAHWVVTYGAEQRTRSPQLIIDLLYRTNAEKIRLLRITLGRRIEITGVPDNFPEGAAHLVVTGITHEIGLRTRRMLLTTSAVIGAEPGTAGPWFRLGASRPDGSDSLLP